MPIGSYPAVLGHEGIGIVRQVGSSSHPLFTPGDTILLSFHTCGQCQACREGRNGGCSRCTEINFVDTVRRGPAPTGPISLPNGDPVHGQFFGQSSLSKLAVVTAKCAVKIDARPKDLAFLAPLACGYLTGAGTVLNVLKPRVNETVAILGMGAVGLAALMAAKSLGVQHIIAVDIVHTKLEMAIALGATHTVNTKSNPDINSALRDVHPEGIDSIIDTTGVPTILEASVKALAHGGTLALVGVPPPTAQLQINALDLLVSCKRIVGVIEGLCDPKVVNIDISEWCY